MSVLLFFQHPYEDPEGRIDLPASIRCQVDHWKRPVEFIVEKVQLEMSWPVGFCVQINLIQLTIQCTYE